MLTRNRTCTCSAAGVAKAAAAARARQSDQAALLQIALRQGTCEATGASLNYQQTIVCTVADPSSGLFRAAVVTAAHWDAGVGRLSSSDPAVSPDVLDGRVLFTADDDHTMVPARLRGAELVSS